MLKVASLQEVGDVMLLHASMPFEYHSAKASASITKQNRLDALGKGRP
jgi:hypothetical protein